MHERYGYSKEHSTRSPSLVVKGVSLKRNLQIKYITIKGVKLRKPSIFVVI